MRPRHPLALQRPTLRRHLYDDQHVLTLPTAIVAAPPVVIWPEAIIKGEIPADVIEAFSLRL